MGLLERMKRSMQSWLEITPAQKNVIQITESMDFNMNAAKNRIWVRGDPYELQQFYKALPDDLAPTMFWGAVPANPIRKIHTGLPGLIVEMLTSIVMHDMNAIQLEDRQEEWDRIASESENDINRIIKDAVKQSLYIGDGAFKISYDKSVSSLPIIEFYPGDQLDFIYRRGRLTEIVFKTTKHQSGRQGTYRLYEHYGYGYIKYELKRLSGSQEADVPIDSLDETAQLKDVSFGGYVSDQNGSMISPGAYMMAVPLKFFDSPKWPGRGESIFDRKITDFDALDEIVSQWADAVRSGRSKTYIPDNLIPRDEHGREIIPNPFDDHFVKVGANVTENAKNQIDIKQPAIPSDNYLQSYTAFLDLCLQGLISPSTLGIDTKKLDNAEAQREKEKATLYTRNAIIDALNSALPKLVVNTLATVDSLANKFNPSVLTDEVTVDFGEYANPSFEAVVETVSKAKQGGIMSVRTALDEMYGDTKDDAWKEQEVIRIAEDSGAVQLEAPDVSNIPAPDGTGMISNG